MKEKLLWYDDSPATNLADKVRRAARRYKQKFGTAADICYVHPSALNGKGEVTTVDKMRISARPTVLRHHFWIGRDEAKRDPARPT